MRKYIIGLGLLLAVSVRSAETYLVVDLSGGPNAAAYPVRYTDMPPDLNYSQCRTFELWLRLIPAGTCQVVRPEQGYGSVSTTNQITITKPFYIGVFEVTQRQWESVMGTQPSCYLGDTRPVERVSYEMIRGASYGAQWPTNNQVSAASFMGVLRQKAKLMFDLPTELQWEYACRAGTSTYLNSGKKARIGMDGQSPDLSDVGRYKYNAWSKKGGYSEHTKVGVHLPNAWGLYDMHGNVFEWCLDWYEEERSASSIVDYVGPLSGTHRVLRGGYYDGSALSCLSDSRSYFAPNLISAYVGFRVCVLPKPAP